MKLVVHNYWGGDDLESQIRAAWALYQRPGTPGEKAAALEALKRLRARAEQPPPGRPVRPTLGERYGSRNKDASVILLKPAREMTLHEIEAELAAAPKSNAFGFPGGKVRYEALKQVAAEKRSRGEGAR